MSKIFSIFKKINLAILIASVITVSLEKGVLLLISTYHYFLTQVPWYEWVNYLFLGLGTLFLPIWCLFFLDRVYVRRFLRIYLFGMIFTLTFVLIEDAIIYIDRLWMYERPFNSILVLLEFFSISYCWLFLTRQIRGKSLISVDIQKEDQYWSLRFKDKLLFPITSILGFVKKSSMTKKRVIKFALISNLIIFSGLVITMIPENHSIVLHRPEDHEMQISYWGSSNRFDNSTLDILGAQNAKIYAWGDYRDSDWVRYGERGVEVILVKGFETNTSKRNEDFQEIVEMMNYLDLHSEIPVVGFCDDMEQFTGISRFNSTFYKEYIEYIQNKTNYVVSRGYEYHITQWLASINDLRDLDQDVSIVYNNPFDPIKFENLTSIGWMIYRSEEAIIYDEPFEYFTYHWADQVNKYLYWIENYYELPQGTWKNKSTISIGVSTSSSLFTFNINVNPNAQEQWFKEMQIHHAMETNEVIIFIGGTVNDTEGFMGIVGGDAGLQEMYDMLYTYEIVEVKYKRRATFFGNLKLWSNITGSVIGLFYSDLFYEPWVGYISFLWIAIAISFSAILNLKKKQAEKSEVLRKNQTKLPWKIIKITIVGLIAMVFILTLIFFWYRPLFLVIQNYL